MHKATIDAANNASDPRAAQLSMEAKTIQGQLYKLKPRTYAQLALLVLILFLFLYWHWQLVLVVLALLIPTLGKLLTWWQKHPERCPLDHVLSSYCLGLFVLAVPAMATALIAFVLTFWILVIIFFSLPLPDALSLLLVVLGCWGVFCLIEDLWHVSFLRRQNRARAHHHRGPTAQRKAGVAYAAATAVGYATAQCVALTCIVTAFMDGHSYFEWGSERRHSEKGDITKTEGVFLFFFALIFTWYWLRRRGAAGRQRGASTMLLLRRRVPRDGFGTDVRPPVFWFLDCHRLAAHITNAAHDVVFIYYYMAVGRELLALARRRVRGWRAADGRRVAARPVRRGHDRPERARGGRLAGALRLLAACW